MPANARGHTAATTLGDLVVSTYDRLSMHTQDPTELATRASASLQRRLGNKHPRAFGLLFGA